jgi:hypothetical protein
MAIQANQEKNDLTWWICYVLLYGMQFENGGKFYVIPPKLWFCGVKNSWLLKV